jgi:hypothetical protein
MNSEKYFVYIEEDKRNEKKIDRQTVNRQACVLKPVNSLVHTLYANGAAQNLLCISTISNHQSALPPSCYIITLLKLLSVMVTSGRGIS